MIHENWRSCKEWRDEGLPMSTPNNRASKLFDAALTQYVSWKEIDSLGGLEKTLDDLKKADPEFGLGRVLENAIRFMGTSTPPQSDETFRHDLETTYEVCSKSNLNRRESLHLGALKHLDDGFMSKACLVWEEILLHHPTDMMALKLAQDGYFYLGDKVNMMSSISRASRAWSSSLPLYGYLHGMTAFALCENKNYLESEEAAKKGLDLNPYDAWCTHALAHVHEMTGQYCTGEKFLESTVLDWEVCNLLSCHTHWHNALFSIERGDFDKALNIFDEKIGSRAVRTGAMLDIVDACSLLYRLQMEGQKVKDRYRLLYDTCLSHDKDHVLTFNDLHFLMTFLGAGERSQAETFIQTMKNYVRISGTPGNDYITSSSSPGIAISEAMLAFDVGNFDVAVELLKPLEHEIVKIGGSDAQRDVFAQLLLNAATSSNIPTHRELARSLLEKRKEQKSSSLVTERLVAKFLSAQESSGCQEL